MLAPISILMETEVVDEDCERSAPPPAPPPLLRICAPDMDFWSLVLFLLQESSPFPIFMDLLGTCSCLHVNEKFLRRFLTTDIHKNRYYRILHEKFTGRKALLVFSC